MNINDDMLVLNKNILFSPRIFAYFGYSVKGDAFQPVFSDRLGREESQLGCRYRGWYLRGKAIHTS